MFFVFPLNCNKKTDNLQPHAIIFLGKTAHSKDGTHLRGRLSFPPDELAKGDVSYMNDSEKKRVRPVKTAGDNQWTTSHRKSSPDKRPRRDGPGGEPGQKTDRK